MGPEEIERVIGAISEKDVMEFAQRKLWDQDVAVSAVGSIEGYVISIFRGFGCIMLTWETQTSRLHPYPKRYEQERLRRLCSSWGCGEVYSARVGCLFVHIGSIKRFTPFRNIRLDYFRMTYQQLAAPL